MKILLISTLLLATKAMAEAPSWFSDYVRVNPGCQHDYLCVVGVGGSLNSALSEARNEAAKYFQTKVKSQSIVSQSSEQKGNSPLSANFQERTNKTMSEETDEIISGLEIKRQEEVGGSTYVLMVLDRAKAAKQFREKIEALDAENSESLSLNSRFTYPKIQKNLALIEAYTQRFDLMSSTPIKLKVDKVMMTEKINHLKPLKMALVAKGRRLPQALSHELIDLLSSLKVVVVGRKTSPSYVLRSEVITEEQYLKVEGFKKLNVSFRLELLNSESLVMGKISSLSEQVARSEQQAIEKAIPEIKEHLSNHLDQLTTIKMAD